jgi:hypothetical protein
MQEHEVAFALLFAAGEGPPVEFANTATSGAGTSVTKPSGLAAGDLVIVWALQVDNTLATLTTSGGSAWTVVENYTWATAYPANHSMPIFAKVMTALDVTNAWNLGSAAVDGAMAIRYDGRGATTVTAKTSTATGSNGDFDVTAAGFTKAAGHYGALTLAISTNVATDLVQPAGFTDRLNLGSVAVADRLTGYVDGAGATWTDFNSPPPGPTHLGRAILLEITGP